MFPRLYFIFLVSILLFSCHTGEKYGRIIPNYERIKKAKDFKIIDRKLNIEEYNKKITYTDNGKYLIEIYTHNNVYDLDKYSDEYRLLHGSVYGNEDRDKYFFSSLNIIDINTNEKIASGIFINPNEEIILYKNKIYYHKEGSINEIDLQNKKETIIYGYGKFYDVEINELLNKSILITIKGMFPVTKEYRVINKKIKINI